MHSGMCLDLARRITNSSQQARSNASNKETEEAHKLSKVSEGAAMEAAKR